MALWTIGGEINIQKMHLLLVRFVNIDGHAVAFVAIQVDMVI